VCSRATVKALPFSRRLRRCICSVRGSSMPLLLPWRRPALLNRPIPNPRAYRRSNIRVPPFLAEGDSVWHPSSKPEPRFTAPSRSYSIGKQHQYMHMYMHILWSRTTGWSTLGKDGPDGAEHRSQARGHCPARTCPISGWNLSLIVDDCQRCMCNDSTLLHNHVRILDPVPDPVSTDLECVSKGLDCLELILGCATRGGPDGSRRESSGGQAQLENVEPAPRHQGMIPG